jgi:methionyl-tRNA formyltransferase
MKIFSSAGEVVPVSGSAGEIGMETERGLPVAAKDGYVYLKDIQLEGKKKMSVHDFLKGFRLLPGENLG